MIEIEATALPDVLMVRTKVHMDSRGFFMETYNQAAFAKAGITEAFVQDNVSLSAQMGTVRGLHFQLPPFAQAKLIRVVRGKVLDIAVDLRRASPTFGRHVAIELSESDRQQIFIPVGFAHGFCTLESNTEVQYKVSASYSPAHDRGLAWDDPALGISWPVTSDRVVLSDKDTKHPRLAALAGELF